jgi:hypothetical protein
VIIDVCSRAKFDLLISCFGSLDEGCAGILVDIEGAVKWKASVGALSEIKSVADTKASA